MTQLTKNLREWLSRLTLPPVLLSSGFVLLVARPTWPVVAGLAITAAVYALTGTAHMIALVRDLETLRTKLTKHSNRLGD